MPVAIYNAIKNLREKVWDNVQDEQTPDPEVFYNLEKTINKVLCKELGSLEKVVFLMTTEG